MIRHTEVGHDVQRPGNDDGLRHLPDQLVRRRLSRPSAFGDSGVHQRPPSGTAPAVPYIQPPWRASDIRAAFADVADAVVISETTGLRTSTESATRARPAKGAFPLAAVSPRMSAETTRADRPSTTAARALGWRPDGA